MLGQYHGLVCGKDGEVLSHPAGSPLREHLAGNPIALESLGAWVGVIPGEEEKRSSRVGLLTECPAVPRAGAQGWGGGDHGPPLQSPAAPQRRSLLRDLLQPEPTVPTATTASDHRALHARGTASRRLGQRQGEMG